MIPAHSQPQTFVLLVALLTAAALAACENSGAGSSAAPASPTASASTPGPRAAAPSGSAEIMDECPGGHDGACGQGAGPAPDQTHFGAAFALDRAEPLAKVADGLSKQGKVVQVSGTVESVCQMAGCWMVLRDGEVRARVFTKAHGFFLRKNIAGKKARAEGKLQPRVLGEGFAKHLDRDRGSGGATANGPRQELVMDATAVELD